MCERLPAGVRVYMCLGQAKMHDKCMTCNMILNFENYLGTFQKMLITFVWKHTERLSEEFDRQFAKPFAPLKIL